MRANEFITEVFQPGKTNWEWARRSSDEASAFFKVGDREYLWQAFNGISYPKKWEIQFRLLRDYDNDPEELDLFGKTGTGNSAEVMSTAVDITRAFLKEYGLDRVEEITFNAKEDSRIALYAKMIKRLLPDWDLYSKKDPVDGMTFSLTDRRAYDKPENQISELFNPQTSYQLEWDDRFGPKEIHARAYDRQGKYIDINFVPVRDNVTDIEFSKMDSFDLTHDEDAPRVFATVLEAIKKYLQGYQPKIIVFSGKEKSRAGLYQRLINRFAGQYGYKQFDTSKLSPDAKQKLGASGTSVFILRKMSEPVDEGWKDWVAGAALGAAALSPQAADAKSSQLPDKPAIVQPAQQSPAGYNVLSNNSVNEITLQKAAKQAGLKGAELAQFMAQMKHESWDFDRMKEKAQPGVKDYYSKKYDIKYSPKTAKILGNKRAGDGARYYGRGFVQLTGRDNYRMASDALGIDLLKNPELASNPEVAAKIAVWYWNTRVKPNVQNFADTASVTKYINPAAHGLQSRNENFKDYMRII